MNSFSSTKIVSPPKPLVIPYPPPPPLACMGSIYLGMCAMQILTNVKNITSLSLLLLLRNDVSTWTVGKRLNIFCIFIPPVFHIAISLIQIKFHIDGNPKYRLNSQRHYSNLVLNHYLSIENWDYIIIYSPIYVAQ